MATSQGFNKPRVNFTKVNRKKKQERRKAEGRAQKGKAAALAVSGARTKKHARKMAHRERMQERAELAAQQEEVAAPAATEVAMKKPRVKKSKAKKDAPQAMQE